MTFGPSCAIAKDKIASTSLDSNTSFGVLKYLFGRRNVPLDGLFNITLPVGGLTHRFDKSIAFGTSRSTSFGWSMTVLDQSPKAKCFWGALHKTKKLLSIHCFLRALDKVKCCYLSIVSQAHSTVLVCKNTREVLSAKTLERCCLQKHSRGTVCKNTREVPYLECCLQKHLRGTLSKGTWPMFRVESSGTNQSITNLLPRHTRAPFPNVLI